MLKSLNQNWRRGTFIGLGLWIVCIVLNGAYKFSGLFDIVVCSNLVNLGAIFVYARIKMGIKNTDTE